MFQMTNLDLITDRREGKTTDLCHAKLLRTVGKPIRNSLITIWHHTFSITSSMTRQRNFDRTS